MNEANPSKDALVEKLQLLRPVKAHVDLRDTFYQAGYEACRTQMQARNHRNFFIGIAATLLALIVSVPVSYQAGRTTAAATGSQSIAPRSVVKLDPSATPTNGRDNRGERKEHQEEMSPTDGATSPVQPTAERDLADDAGADPKPTSAIELATKPRTKNQFATWMNALSNVARSTKLDRQSESMVMTSHASLFALESSIRNLSEFPISVSAPSQFSSSLKTESADSDTGSPRRTLAVGDFSATTFGLEVKR